MVERWGPLLGSPKVWYSDHAGYRIEIHREVVDGRAMVRLYLLKSGEQTSKECMLFEFQRHGSDEELLGQALSWFHKTRRR
jgi:hypothetical protein